MTAPATGGRQAEIAQLIKYYRRILALLAVACVVVFLSTVASVAAWWTSMDAHRTLDGRTGLLCDIHEAHGLQGRAACVDE